MTTITHTDFDSVLDECLARMAAGESVDACLQKYPQHAAALRPLLDVAVRLHALPSPQPRADAVRAGQQRMLAAFREQKLVGESSVSPLSRYAGRIREFFAPSEGMQMRHVLRFAVAMLLVLLVGTNLAVVSSAGSIPGDPLYGVKRSWEEARLALTIRERARAQLLEHLVERRQDEVREMVQQGREGTLDLEGILRLLGDGRWSVNGLALVLSGQTDIEGELEPGASAWVRAKVRNDGALAALRVRIRTRRQSPTAAASLETPDDMPNGRLRTATPVSQRTPEPSRPPQATRAPEPTATTRPSATPEPAETREGEGDPAQAETREPEHTPEPTRTREPDHTPEPADTHEPDHTPEPSETHEPDQSPEPAETHEPDHTPEPNHTPEPTDTREPEHTPEPTRTHEPDHMPEPTGEPQRTPQTGELQRTPVPTGGPQSSPGPTNDHDQTLEPASGAGALQGAPQPDGDTEEPQQTPELEWTSPPRPNASGRVLQREVLLNFIPSQRRSTNEVAPYLQPSRARPDNGVA